MSEYQENRMTFVEILQRSVRAYIPRRTPDMTPGPVVVLAVCLWDLVMCMVPVALVVTSVILFPPSGSSAIEREQENAFCITILLIAIGLMASAAAMAVVRIWRVRRRGTALIWFSDSPATPWMPSVIRACLTIAALNILLIGVSKLFSAHDLMQAPSIWGLLKRGLPEMTGSASVLFNLCAILVSPFAEECVFRGLIYGRFRAGGYPITGAFVSAALFTILPGAPLLDSIGIFGLGLALAWLYYRSGSLWLTIAAHCWSNALLIAVRP
jgi:membrane protease YdiL (CAAX protease family)